MNLLRDVTRDFSWAEREKGAFTRTYFCVVKNEQVFSGGDVSDTKFGSGASQRRAGLTARRRSDRGGRKKSSGEIRVHHLKRRIQVRRTGCCGRLMMHGAAGCRNVQLSVVSGGAALMIG
jgi:hypothetical protein